IQRGGVLALRMIRGVIAQTIFSMEIVEYLVGWSDITPQEDLPYDFLLEDGVGVVRVQVKLQRSEAHLPMLRKSMRGYWSSLTDMYVVETQRTRGGIDKKTGAPTRPYRFGEFDILAVSMYPSTNEWVRFMYTVSNWLIPSPTNATEILK